MPAWQRTVTSHVPPVTSHTPPVTSRAPPSTASKCLLRATHKPNVRRGQLLLASEPFIYLLKSACARERCSFCLARAKLQRCAGCQLLYFCNRQCQKNAWADFHRFECRRLKAVSPRVPPDTALLMARLIVKLRHGGDRVSERVTDTRFRSFKDLMSHYKDVKASPQRLEHVTSLTVVLRALLPEDSFPNVSELIGMYGRVTVNSFNILDGEMSPIGVGVYLAPSIIDHSCQPNATATFSGRSIAVRAISDIPDFTWDKVRISYIDTMADTETRRRELRQGYFFDCDCERCAGEEFADLERALRCGTADCPTRVVLPPRDSEHPRPRCPRCQCEDFPSDVAGQLEEVRECARSLAEDSTVYYDLCLRCLERQQPLLHPLNVYRVKTADLALEAAISTDMWERCLALGEQLEEGYRLYYGPFHPLTGVFYLKLGKIALYRFRHGLARRFLVCAAEVIRVTHGSDHLLYRESLLPLLQQVEAEMEATGRSVEASKGRLAER